MRKNKFKTNQIMKEIIKTTDPQWLEKAITHYSNKKEFSFIDDAELGFTETDLHSAVDMIKAAKTKGGKTLKQITAVLVGLGMSAAGIGIIILAILDPEPTTKLGLLVGGGLLLVLTGSYATMKSLGVNFSVSAKAGTYAFDIKPE